jgi:purine-binding chemotaxis protein CheW
LPDRPNKLDLWCFFTPHVKKTSSQWKAATMVEQSAPDSQQSASMADNKNTSQFVGFEIDGQQYAFRIEQIQEIVILDSVTPTPGVVDHVEGVSNLRGAIIPIVNLRKLIGLEPKPADSETRTIVVNVGERTMGCTVDAVSQVIRIPTESIQPAPDTVTADGADFISGFAKLNDRLVILLDIDELLSPERLDRDRSGDARRSPSSS